MQAIALSTTISAHGGIALPANFKALYGRDARMILLIDDDVAVAQAGTFGHVEDAGAWPREVRTERRQPGRGD